VRDMEGLSASVVLIAIMLGVLLVVAFDVFCLLRLATADTAHFLPKFAWAVLIVCTSPIGDSDRRAISGPLTPATSSPSRSSTDSLRRRSGAPYVIRQTPAPALPLLQRVSPARAGSGCGSSRWLRCTRRAAGHFPCLRPGAPRCLRARR